MQERMVQERMPVLREEKKRTRSSRKLVYFLILLFVTLLAVLFFRSSLSKVAQIEISGYNVLTSEQIGQAAVIQNGDSFFGFRTSTVEKRIKQLEAVEDVVVKKKFPGSVRISVQEYPGVAYQLMSNGDRQMILSNGLAVVINNQNLIMDKPILSGWNDNDPWKLKLCETLRLIPNKMIAEISEIRPSPTKTYEDKIKMYTRSQFEVYTTVTYLPDKLQYLDEMIQQMADKNVFSGVFELLEANTHIPFEQYYGKSADASKDTDPKKAGTTSGAAKTDPKDTTKR
ncbi:MAG: cell division protein FtsQ [Paenibacillus sp.]|nr:cell division protein FtsQ [Paenibacillus sp.]